ncbi:hypothetical protein CTAYLR_009076 [Chrysophaeum taylorii]|uniref:PPM-type phosphatase domain-containing protein n=1 Tax=Chrysophaeum taylorii TaxID=2483200 RepID=A0AAD7ULM6_9STRA|nr:hypothetical protein CTAYLR_009076 [Chrysophaeum taylorii]
MGAGASALPPTEQQQLAAQQLQLSEKAGVSTMNEDERMDFERKLQELYDAHGGNAIFQQPSERQQEIYQTLERETEKLRKLAIESSDFRKRRLSYSIHPQACEQLLNGHAVHKSRRPSLEFRSPPFVSPSPSNRSHNRSNRRLKVKPNDEDDNQTVEAEAALIEPPFDDSTLGTYSHHGIEPKYYGEGFSCKINQDRGCVVHPYVDSDRQSLFCVFDGHGERGEEVSEFVLESIVGKLELDPDLQTRPDKALVAAFLRTDDELAKSNIDSFFSGTTAVVVYRNGNELYTANAGDSRAIIARRDPETQLHAVHPLSIDQNPDTPGERERIEAAGGFVSDPPGEGLSARVWLDKNMTRVGLAMARSLGDNAVKKVGVIAEPEVRKYLLTAEDEFMVMASDGVWEFISSDDAVRAIALTLEATNSAKDACKNLIDLAIQRWKENEGDYRDDITAIVMRLRPYDT